MLFLKKERYALSILIFINSILAGCCLCTTNYKNNQLSLIPLVVIRPRNQYFYCWFFSYTRRELLLLPVFWDYCHILVVTIISFFLCNTRNALLCNYLKINQIFLYKKNSVFNILQKCEIFLVCFDWFEVWKRFFLTAGFLCLFVYIISWVLVCKINF